MSIVCRNCHRKLTDQQHDHVLYTTDEPNGELATIGRYLLGLCDLLALEGLDQLIVAGYEQARLVGEHHHAVGSFVRTNDIELIKPFEGQSVRAASGRKYPLETDPNALHRIAAMDTPPFHEIYAITSTS